MCISLPFYHFFTGGLFNFIDYPLLMKQAILFAVFITVIHPGFARTNPANQIRTSFGITNTDTTSVQFPQIPEMLLDIMSVTGLQCDFELREAKVLNIEATISHHKRYISYNPSFMEWINQVTNDKWAGYVLLAHEIGHHLDGHTIRKTGSTPAVELEADEFAGFVLFKLGATLQQAQHVMYYIAGAEASATHPARISRLQAIEKGWSRAAHI